MLDQKILNYRLLKLLLAEILILGEQKKSFLYRSFKISLSQEIVI